jgi:hypothetical protein
MALLAAVAANLRSGSSAGSSKIALSSGSDRDVESGPQGKRDGDYAIGTASLPIGRVMNWKGVSKEVSDSGVRISQKSCI